MNYRCGSLTKRFMAACALGLALSAGGMPAFAQDANRSNISATTSAPVLDTQKCTNETATRRDEQGHSWIAVKAETSDGLPVNFDLSINYILSEKAQALDKTLCLGLDSYIHNQAALIYRHGILALRYGEMPEKAPGLAANMAARLTRHLETILSSAGEEPFTIKGIGIQNVEAPGLNADYGRAMMTGGIKYPPPQDIDPYRFVLWSQDGVAAELEISVKFQPRKEVYYEIGPNDAGIKANVVSIVAEIARRESRHWHSSCLKDDAVHLRNFVFTEAAEDLRLAPYVHLLDLKIQNIRLRPETDQIPPDSLPKPEKARCYSQAFSQ